MRGFYEFGVDGKLLAAGGLKESQYGQKAWKLEVEAGAKEWRERMGEKNKKKKGKVKRAERTCGLCTRPGKKLRNGCSKLTSQIYPCLSLLIVSRPRTVLTCSLEGGWASTLE